MSKRCEQLRNNALRDGLDSHAGLAWRVHCRSCQACRTELYILETLQRQARNERSHLGRDELDRLLHQVREVQATRRRGSRIKRVTVQLAGLAVALLLLAMIPGAGKDKGASGSWLQTPAAKTGGSGQIALAGTPSRAGLAKNQAAAEPEAPKLRFGCEHRIIQLRRQLNRRREWLQKQLEHELGGSSDDQGAYDAADAALVCALV